MIYDTYLGTVAAFPFRPRPLTDHMYVLVWHVPSIADSYRGTRWISTVIRI